MIENFATLETKKIGSEITSKVDDYRNFVDASGIGEIWRRCYKQYYSGFFYGADLQRAGDQGEYVKGSVNHYRNILQHILTMATQNRIQFEPRAVNTDYKSMAQTVLAKNLLDYYMRSEHIEQTINDAIESALICGESYMYVGWDFAAGDVIGIAEQEPVIGEDGQPVEQPQQAPKRAGDICVRTYLPRDVIRQSMSGKQNWYILIDRVNRFELATKYSDFSQEILDASIDTDAKYSETYTDVSGYKQDEDNIPVYTLVHRKSATLPNGRLVECLNDGTVVFDGDLPYEEFPVCEMVPSRLKDMPFGYSIGFDLMPLQIAHDGVFSSIVTNQNAFGVQNVLVPNGSDVSVSNVSDGLNFIAYNAAAGKPEPLNLLQTPAEMYKFVDSMNNMMQTISGVNSVARGNPEASLKSGAALALVQSMAIQFNSMFQNAYAMFCESIGTSIIGVLKRYAKVPRIAAISGKTNRSYLKEFTGDDVSQITRVSVDLGNPLQRTTAGRVQIAETMLEKGMLKTPEEYLMVVDTGRLEPLIEGDRNELLLIRSENEVLMQGGETPVIATDMHPMHIKEHKNVLSSPEMRQNPEIVNSVLNHITMHIEELKSADPDMLAMLGMQSLMPSPMPMGPDGIPIEGAPMPEGGPAEGMPMGEPAPAEMPQNPLTGNQFDTQTGGL